MIKNKQELNINMTLVLILVFIPLILPDYLQTITIIDDLSILLAIIIFIVALTLSILYKKMNIFVILSILFLVWRYFSSYYLAGSITDFSNILKTASVLLMINLVVRNYTKPLIRALYIIFVIYIVANFLSLLIFPEGLYLDNPRDNQYRSAWLLGIRNQFAYFIIPGIAIVLLHAWFFKNRLTLISSIVLIIAVVSILSVSSATAIVSIVLLLVLYLINLRKKIKPFISFSNLSILYVGIWILLVVSNSIGPLQTLIVDYLERDMTLSGRTAIWEQVLNVIPESFWYGFGINVRILVSHTYFGSHNLILQTTLESGIIGLILLISCVVVSGIQLQKFRNSNITIILLVAVFGIFIGGLTESYRLNYLFLLMALSWNVKHLIMNQKLYLEKKGN
ncbi:O-antigen ligase family protein [Shouchella oshimensis]|uniref:O-antigen ligase family protein n=1 Tax=Shouchella oshimensis TaxID=290588 RepID=UPI000ACC2B29|nr:O-antigen ligase family protein [Shouchella oshimensis]